MYVLIHDILPILLVCCGVLGVLLAAEFIRLKQRKPTEFQRKFVHIMVGCFAATWPLYLHWWQIQLLSLLAVGIVLLSKQLMIFRSIFGVKRHTWGELFFAAVIGILALITHDPAVFALAMLQMSIADGFAALIGIHFGKSTQYKVFGNIKSVVGTLAFFAISAGLLLAYSHFATPLTLTHIVLLALGVSALENLGVRGFDNLFVPIVIALALS